MLADDSRQWPDNTLLANVSTPLGSLGQFAQEVGRSGPIICPVRLARIISWGFSNEPIVLNRIAGEWPQSLRDPGLHLDDI